MSLAAKKVFAKADFKFTVHRLSCDILALDRLRFSLRDVPNLWSMM